MFVNLLWVNSIGMRSARVLPYDYYMKEGCEVNLCSAAYFLPAGPPNVLPGIGGDVYTEVRAFPVRSSYVGHLPWAPQTSACMVDFHDKEGQPWDFCGRNQLKKALIAAKQEYDLEIQAGFELEFQIFQESAPGQAEHERTKAFERGPYCSADSLDIHLDVITDIAKTLKAMGIEIESIHKESGPSNIEIVTAYGPILEAVDKLVMTKHAIKACCRKRGFTACFLPLAEKGQQAANGSHVHMSLWKNGKNVVASDDNPSGEISLIAQNFIAGILKSFRALLALMAPTNMSLRRFSQDRLSGAYTCWGYENRKCAIRIPQANGGNRLTNFEIKALDHLANPYYALAATIQLGVHGLRLAMELPSPIAGDPSELAPNDAAANGTFPFPKTVEESNQFLL